MGIPKNGWVSLENPNLKWMMTGGSPMAQESRPHSARLGWLGPWRAGQSGEDGAQLIGAEQPEKSIIGIYSARIRNKPYLIKVFVGYVELGYMKLFRFLSQKMDDFRGVSCDKYSLEYVTQCE